MSTAVQEAIDWQTRRVDVEGVQIEFLAGGQGQPLIVLHDQDYLNTPWPYLDQLARQFAVMAPSHPGFGQSALPEGMDSVDDLAYLYLDLLRGLQKGPVCLLGFGFGGWIAAELAVRCTHGLDRLVLVDPLGIKVGDRTTRDITDNFLLDTKGLLEASWHDPDAGARTMKLPGPDLPEQDLVTLLRNRQSSAFFGWKPFMHNPKLRQRLRRIDVPTLVLWGESDGIVRPDYGRAYAAAIPSARFQLIERAGHYPYLEQPEAFDRAVLEFLKESH